MTRAGLAAAVAVLLVAGLVGVVTVDRTDSHVTRPPTSTTISAPAAGVAGVEAFVPVAEAFIEQHRGLKFTAPVTVTALGADAFRQRLADTQNASIDRAQVEKSRKVLQALGLIPPGTDLLKAEQALTGNAVVGFYDPKTKDLVVRGAALTPYVRQVIVHELTHAVQDQHFGIDRPDLDKADDERSEAFSALVEGDAVRVENEYHRAMTPAEQAQADKEGAGGDISPNIPEVLVALLIFPYQVGPPFTQAVIRARGLAGLDAAFVHPPTTSEQVMHPEVFLAGEGPKAVAAPPADGKIIDRGVLGEYGLDLVLLPATDSGRLSAAQVQEAGRGWGGDSYVAWDRGAQTCLRDTIVMDTATDTNQLVSALRTFAATRTGITVAGTGPVTLTSCG